MILGKPTDHFVEEVLPEFVEIAFSKREFQEHSTHSVDPDGVPNQRITHNLLAARSRP